MNASVRDRMTSDPFAVRADESALGALDLMLEHGVRHLPVLDDERRVVGILSFDDLRAALPFDVSRRSRPGVGERHRMLDLAVSDAMTWAPHTVRPEAPVAEAARRLAESRIGCLPVVDERGRLLGILSETDVLRAFVSALESEAPSSVERAAAREGLVGQLWAERERLVRQLAQWQETERDLSADIRDEPRDSADRGTDESDVARLESLSGRASQRLRGIEVALERAEQGRLGVCERCEGRIPATRLRALPETTLCVRCARLDAGEPVAIPEA
jgi:CBS domain-containing protein